MKLHYVGRLFDNTYRVHLHHHELWEVVYYTDGCGKVQIDGELMPFEKGDIFVIPPHILHTDYSDNGFRNYHYTIQDFELQVIRFLKLQDSENSDFLRILQQLYLEYHLKRENWNNIAECLCQVLHQYILSFSCIPQQNAYVSAAIKKIISNISNCQFDLEAMIADIPLNSDYFRKLFQRQIGKTPLQFLTEKRIDYARQLLRTKKISRLSIKEIAWRSGFSDFYYFSRVFKKKTGRSPSSWE